MPFHVDSVNLSCFLFVRQAIIRQLLLSSLNDSHGKIRTAVSMAVASIAHYDWQEDWPELLPILLKLISDQSNSNGGNFRILLISRVILLCILTSN